jgi:hypothetical protein
MAVVVRTQSPWGAGITVAEWVAFTAEVRGGEFD